MSVEQNASNGLSHVVDALHRSNQEIQTYAIALINALFLKAPEDRRQVSPQPLALLRSIHWTNWERENKIEHSH